MKHLIVVFLFFCSINFFNLVFANTDNTEQKNQILHNLNSMPEGKKQNAGFYFDTQLTEMQFSVNSYATTLHIIKSFFNNDPDVILALAQWCLNERRILTYVSQQTANHRNYTIMSIGGDGDWIDYARSQEKANVYRLEQENLQVLHKRAFLILRKHLSLLSLDTLIALSNYSDIKDDIGQYFVSISDNLSTDVLFNILQKTDLGVIKEQLLTVWLEKSNLLIHDTDKQGILTLNQALDLLVKFPQHYTNEIINLVQNRLNNSSVELVDSEIQTILEALTQNTTEKLSAVFQIATLALTLKRDQFKNKINFKTLFPTLSLWSSNASDAQLFEYLNILSDVLAEELADRTTTMNDIITLLTSPDTQDQKLSFYRDYLILKNKHILFQNPKIRAYVLNFLYQYTENFEHLWHQTVIGANKEGVHHYSFADVYTAYLTSVQDSLTAHEKKLLRRTLAVISKKLHPSARNWYFPKKLWQQSKRNAARSAFIFDCIEYLKTKIGVGGNF